LAAEKGWGDGGGLFLKKKTRYENAAWGTQKDGQGRPQEYGRRLEKKTRKKRTAEGTQRKMTTSAGDKGSTPQKLSPL